jgi:mannose-6-phosphate isomerase class I
MCWNENEDYFECLHGFKEKQRIIQIQAEKKRREKLGEKFDIS